MFKPPFFPYLAGLAMLGLVVCGSPLFGADAPPSSGAAPTAAAVSTPLPKPLVASALAPVLTATPKPAVAATPATGPASTPGAVATATPAPLPPFRLPPL